MKITLPIFVYGERFQTVDAEIVDVAPHLMDWSFAVHKSYVVGGCWTVSNIETGTSIAIRPSRDLAISHAVERLSTKSHLDMKRAARRLPAELRQ